MRAVSLLLFATLGLVSWAAEDDLFTGAPKDDFEKRSAPFSAKQWGAIVIASDAEPLTIPPGSRTAQEFDRDLHAWMDRTIGDPARAEIQGDPAEAQLRALIAAVITRQSIGGGEIAKSGKDALAVARGEKRRPFLDYCAASVLYITGQNEPAVNLQRSVAADKNLPLLFRLLAQTRVLAYATSYDREKVEAARARYDELFVEHTRTEIAEADAPFVLRWHFLPPLASLRYERLAWHLPHLANSKWPEWMRLNLVGEVELHLGFQARGSGWAKDLPPDAVKSFREHMEKSEPALTRAWELQPDLPWAASSMIWLRMSLTGGRDPAVRLWLDRTVAARSDYQSAWDAAFQALRPRYNGSYESLLALGRSCALTQRFDTEIPTQFNRAVHEIAVDFGDWNSLYRYPEIARLLIETREKRLEKVIGMPAENDHRSLLFLERSLIGDPAGAATVLPHLVQPDGSLKTASVMNERASALGVDRMRLWADAEFAASSLTGEWTEARARTAEGKYEESIALLQQLRARVNGGITRAAISAELALAHFQTRLAGGEWQPLPMENSLAYRTVEGTHRLRSDKKTLRLGSQKSTTFGCELFRGELGTRFELRGKWDFSRGENRGGLCFYFGHAPEFRGGQPGRCWTLRTQCDRADDNSADFGMRWAPPKDRKLFPTQPNSEFLLRREEARITLIVDGKEVLTAQLPEKTTGAAGTFGFGAIASTPAAYADISQLEARKLKVPK